MERDIITDEEERKIYIENATKKNQEKILSLMNCEKNLETDPEKKVRMMEHICKACCYIKEKFDEKIVGASNCHLCGEEIEHSYRPVFCCQKCANKYNICIYCGGSLD